MKIKRIGDIINKRNNVCKKTKSINVSSLNKNTEKIIFCKVYIGDSESVLRKYIKDESIDTLFTSPPYFIARGTETWNSYEEYLDKMKKIFKEVYRVIKHGRVIGVNVSDYAYNGKHYPLGADFTNMLVNELKFNYVMTVIWRKPEGISNSFGQFAGNFLKRRNPLYFIPNQNFEYIILVRKGKLNTDYISDDKLSFKYDMSYIDNKLRPYLQAVWDIQPDINPDLRKYCPLIFPEKLVEVFVELFTVPGDIVLDVFAGSGTTGRVSKRLNRNSILIDINKEMINIIRNRVKSVPVNFSDVKFEYSEVIIDDENES